MVASIQHRSLSKFSAVSCKRSSPAVQTDLPDPACPLIDVKLALHSPRHRLRWGTEVGRPNRCLLWSRLTSRFLSNGGSPSRIETSIEQFERRGSQLALSIGRTYSDVMSQETLRQFLGTQGQRLRTMTSFRQLPEEIGPCGGRNNARVKVAWKFEHRVCERNSSKVPSRGVMRLLSHKRLSGAVTSGVHGIVAWPLSHDST